MKSNPYRCMRILGKKYLENTVFSHYGEDFFRPDRVQKIDFYQNHLNKPKIGGIWLSPKESEYGWKEWATVVEYKHFRDKYRWDVKLKTDAKIICCLEEKDLLNLPTSDLFVDGIYACSYIDYGELIRRGYDGLFLSFQLLANTKLQGKHIEGSPIPTFRYWDCESLLLFGTRCIQHVNNIRKSG